MSDIQPEPEIPAEPETPTEPVEEAPSEPTLKVGEFVQRNDGSEHKGIVVGVDSKGVPVIGVFGWVDPLGQYWEKVPS